MITSNIEQVIARLNEMAANGERIDFSDALAAGVNAARALMQFRIFNTGTDANGASLGGYVGKQTRTRSKNKRLLANIADFDPTGGFSEYEKKRLSHGRQIAYKDLEFTGSLRRSIVTAKDGTRHVVCWISNEGDALIAGYQEQYLKRKIFGLSATEETELKTVTNAALAQLYDRLLNTK